MKKGLVRLLKVRIDYYDRLFVCDFYILLDKMVKTN